MREFYSFNGEVLGYFTSKPKEYKNNTFPKNLKGVKDVSKLSKEEFENLPDLVPKQWIKFEYVLSASGLNDDDIK